MIDYDNRDLEMECNKISSEKKTYPIHKCVFEGDVKTLSNIVNDYDISERDPQGLLIFRSFNSKTFSHRDYNGFLWFFAGNTPLHLAAMLGRKGG